MQKAPERDIEVGGGIFCEWKLEARDLKGTL